MRFRINTDASSLMKPAPHCLQKGRKPAQLRRDRNAADELNQVAQTGDRHGVRIGDDIAALGKGGHSGKKGVQVLRMIPV